MSWNRIFELEENTEEELVAKVFAIREEKQKRKLELEQSEESQTPLFTTPTLFSERKPLAPISNLTSGGNIWSPIKDRLLDNNAHGSQSSLGLKSKSAPGDFKTKRQIVLEPKTQPKRLFEANDCECEAFCLC